MARTYQQEIEVRSDDNGISKDIRFENGPRVVVRKLRNGDLRLMLTGGSFSIQRFIVGENDFTLDLRSMS